MTINPPFGSGYCERFDLAIDIGGGAKSHHAHLEAVQRARYLDCGARKAMTETVVQGYRRPLFSEAWRCPLRYSTHLPAMDVLVRETGGVALRARDVLHAVGSVVCPPQNDWDRPGFCCTATGLPPQ